MSKQNQINEEIKAAMKEKNTLKLSVLRSLKNALNNTALISGNINNPLSDLQVVNIIRKEIVKRKDSAEQFSKGNRVDLADKENEEIIVLETFLPAVLSEDEIDALIDKAILDTQAISKKDMGRAIKRAQELADGKIENRVISSKIGAKLA